MSVDTQQLRRLSTTNQKACQRLRDDILRSRRRSDCRARWATKLESQENSMTRKTMVIFMVVLAVMICLLIALAKSRYII